MHKLITLSTKFAALAFCLFLAACSTDLYEEKEKPTPPVVEPNTNLPEDFTWSMDNDTELSVNIEGLGEEKYLVEAYVGNPLIDPAARMIAGSQQKVNNKVAYKRTISIPDGVKMLYLRITDSRERVGVYGFEVTEGSMNCTIGDNGAKTKSAVQLRASSTDIPAVDYSYAGKECIELSGDGKVIVQKGKNYLIPKGQVFSGEIVFPDSEGNCNLYVEGTWQVVAGKDNSFYLELCRLYVLNGGKIERTDRTSVVDMYIARSSSLAVQKGGTIGSVENQMQLSIHTDEDGIFVNEGICYIRFLKLMGSSRVFNNGDLNVSVVYTNSRDIHLVNKHYLIVSGYDAAVGAGAYMTAGGTIDNFCKFYVSNNMVASDMTINQGPYAYLKINVLTSNGMKMFMDAKSMLVGEKAVFSGNPSFVSGGSTDYGLMKFNTVSVAKKQGQVAYAGKLNVATHTHTANGQWESQQWYTMTPEVVFSNYDGIVSIEPDDCNDNTGNENPGTDPSDPDGDVTETNTLPYTYLFEDNWPVKGDYDMNDVVMSVALSNTTSADGKVKAVDIHATLYAVGASKQLAVAFQLDGVPAGAVSESEPNQQYAVVRLIDNAHAELGGAPGASINSFKYDKSRIKQIHKRIEFTTPQEKGISVGRFNLFIVWDSMDATPRNEIHIPGFRGSNKAATHAGSTEVYTSTADGWMWGLRIPLTDFGSFPKEGTSISDAYSGFDKWVAGDNTPGWYLTPNEDKVIVTVEAPEQPEEEPEEDKK